jgi:cyclopropane-fatty-acyl-phospholipid synthase
MVIHSLDFAKDLASGGEVGISEAFIKGHWESPNLTHFLELFCVNQPVIQKLLDGKPLVRLVQRMRHWLNRNTKSGSRRNIHAHYDLGNQFYSAWLDTTMTYSSALFTGKARDLASAQTAKYAALASEIDLRPEHHVLEIGCGWGGFAEYAAREIGARVTGLTISKEQFDFATARMQAAGLSDRVTIKMLDYRDETGVFDRIASIEMFEAVGEEFWPAYFRQLRDRLAPGGKAGLQVITIQEALFKGYKREIDFIRRYVFPGGMLPTPTIMRDMGEQHGLSLSGERIFGHDYAITLAHWRDRFRIAWPQLTPLGFDERFRRLWEYYLSYCEAGFRAGTIDVRQMVFAKP